MTQEELTLFFRSQFLQYIKSAIGKYIKSSNEEILGICSEQDTLAASISPLLQETFDDYGLRLVTFSIAGIDIPSSDPNRQKLEEAFTQKRIMGVLGDDWARQQSVGILKDLANNPGAGGLAAMGAGIGVGAAAGGVFGGLAQHAFSPMAPQAPAGKSPQTATAAGICAACGAAHTQGAKFCTECGTKIEPRKSFCGECGSELLPDAKFCNECGAKRG